MEKGNGGGRWGGRAIKNSAHFLTTKIAICGKRKEGAWLPFSPVYDLCTFFFVLLHVWGNKVGSEAAKTHEFPMRKGGRPCYKARCKSWPNWCLPPLLFSFASSSANYFRRSGFSFEPFSGFHRLLIRRISDSFLLFLWIVHRLVMRENYGVRKRLI